MAVNSRAPPPCALSVLCRIKEDGSLPQSAYLATGEGTEVLQDKCVLGMGALTHSFSKLPAFLKNSAQNV